MILFLVDLLTLLAIKQFRGGQPNSAGRGCLRVYVFFFFPDIAYSGTAFGLVVSSELMDIAKYTGWYCQPELMELELG